MMPSPAEHRPRVVLLTSDQRRHRFLAHALAAGLDLAGVVTECKPADATGTPHADGTDDDARLLRDHFAQRDVAEDGHFGELGPVPVAAGDLLALPRGEANGPRAAAWIAQHRPDALLLFGTGIIGEGLLSAYPGRVVNLHLGLSPYYRGSGTNFWPLADGRPECVGYTIHLASAEVDAGAVLAQGRPGAAATDGPHDLGCKTIAAAAGAMAHVTAAYLAGSLERKVQTGGGRVYRRRDFSAHAVRRMRRRFDGGMMPAYLDDKAARDAACPIVQWPRRGAT